MVYYGKKRSRLIESEEHTMGRKKRKIAKTCLCYFLVCLISFLCIADMPSYKAKASEAIKSVHTSFYEKENIAISIKNEMLYFTKLPDRNSFSKIKVSLYSEGGKKSNEKTLSGSMPYCYNLSGVQNGTYYLQLYYMTKQDDQGRTYYLSYWYQKSGIVLVKDSSGWSILNATPYEKNKEIFSIRSNSGEVLDYFLQPDYMVDSENSQIVSTAKSITKGITNDYDKVVAVHDWVAKNICYDYDGLYGRTDEVEYIASDVLKSKKSVCQGFADLSAALLRAVNIPTRVVDGYALGIGSTSEWTDDIFDNETINHAWNEAYVDGRWIIFDATWDSGNAYENGSYKFSDSEVSYQYFDPTIEVFSSTHYIVDEEGTEFLNQLSDNDLDENISLYEGSKKKIFNEVPDDIAVKWEIANEEVVDITKDGNLKGMVPGSSEVKLIFSKGNCMKTINLKVNVVEQGSSLETIKAPTPTRKTRMIRKRLRVQMHQLIQNRKNLISKIYLNRFLLI
jgi:transglutaminase-like putative cysteine protease